MIREVLSMAQLRAMDPDEAAALWTVRFSDGELPHERELFEEWLGLSAGNREAWDRAQRGWKLFDAAPDDELLEEMRRHARAARPAARRHWQQFAAAAAALVLVVSGSILVDRSGLIGGNGSPSSPTNRLPVEAASYDYVSGRELPRLIALPDGSRITLDAQSHVTARFSDKQRELEVVAGRAFFEVRHDPSRPFMVRAANLRALDIGTRFDVQRIDRTVRITLVDGGLSVTAPGTPKPLLMSAGEQLTAEGDAMPVITRTSDDSTLSWQKGFASFDNMKLSDAAAIFNRYPGQTLVVRDPRVASLRVTGRFRLGDSERFGRTLEEIYPVRVLRRQGEQVEIVSAE